METTSYPFAQKCNEQQSMCNIRRGNRVPGNHRNPRNLLLTGCLRPAAIYPVNDPAMLPSENDSFILLPHVKDTTDTYEAVQLGIKEGCTEFRIYGGTGGRLDHTLANIQLAAQLSQNEKRAYIYGNGYVITALTSGSITLPSRAHGYVSVFSHSNVCEGVTIKGLFYEVENTELRNDFSLGVSNEFIGKEALISARKGTLCIYYEV